MFVCLECGTTAGGRGACPRCGANVAATGDDPIIGSKVGPYQIARLLGEGGMGKVYKGVNPEIGSRVAVKVLSRDCAHHQETVDRFFSEARAVNLIRHENIVNVLDLNVLEDRRPYIVMEYLDGAPLSAHLAGGKPLPIATACRLMVEVLGALAAAHQKGIIHRDLKPDNIFVSPQGRAKVLDFGIAKLVPELTDGKGLTRTGSLLGTPHYMSPEQALAQPASNRSDIYAVGVILYECFAGKLPFAAESLYELLHKQISEQPLAPHQVRADLDKKASALVMRCMEKDPEKRYASAEELSHALHQLSACQPEREWAPLVNPNQFTMAASNPRPSPGFMTSSHPGVGPSATVQGNARKAPLIAAILLAVAGVLGVALFFALQSEAVVAYAELDAGLAEPGAPTPKKETDPETKSEKEPKTEAEPETKGEKEPKTEAEPETKGEKEPEAKPAPGKSPKPTTPPPPPVPTKVYTMPETAERFDISDFNDRAVDVTRYLRKAKKHARRLMPDATLAGFNAMAVTADGKIDLHGSKNANLIIHFVSPSGKKAKDKQPPGFQGGPKCMVTVMLNPHIRHAVASDATCMGRKKAPKCSLEDVWAKALALGAAKNGYADIHYVKSGTFYFSISGSSTLTILDDC